MAFVWLLPSLTEPEMATEPPQGLVVGLGGVAERPGLEPVLNLHQWIAGLSVPADVSNDAHGWATSAEQNLEFIWLPIRGAGCAPAGAADIHRQRPFLHLLPDLLDALLRGALGLHLLIQLEDVLGGGDTASLDLLPLLLCSGSFGFCLHDWTVVGLKWCWAQ